MLQKMPEVGYKCAYEFLYKAKIQLVCLLGHYTLFQHFYFINDLTYGTVCKIVIIDE